MIFLRTALLLLVHLWFWGAGAAILATPRRWRRAWPVFCAPMGLALQSAVVWAGAYSGLAGTMVYARWSEVLPVALLAWAWWRDGGLNLRAAWARFGGLALLTVLDLGLLAWPMARASRVLTTLSLGSCDAADYAAGARVLQEFARGDRSGFLGLTEVVRVASVDNFYDFWLRLNHFTPSALIAFNGAVFGWKPHEITGLLGALVLASTLPGIFWLARTVLRYSTRVSLWLAALYGLSPVAWYAVAHVAIGQLLAAQAILFLTWAGVALWRQRWAPRPAWAMSGVLAMAYWLILGSYNFIVLVCLVPALAYAGGDTLRAGRWPKFGRWLLVMLAPLAVCGAIFTQRVLGLVERFQLFGQYDFGWRIPALSPEGWLGAVTGAGLESFASPLRWVALLALLVLLTAAAAIDLRRRREWVLTGALALVVPAAVGYFYLEARGALLGTNASYDAYKLLSVFLPGVLCGCCYWTRLGRSRSAALHWAAWLGVVLLTVANVTVAVRFSGQMAHPPLIVDRDLVALQAVESRPEVTSINMKIADFWTRLWANAMLLRKPQYFATHTYEGRRNTALKGQWDLTAGTIRVTTPGNAGVIRVGDSLLLQDRASPYFLEVKLGDGWYPEERIVKAGVRWNWSKGDSTVVIENPQAKPRSITLRLNVRSLERRDLQVWQGDTSRGTVEIGEKLSEPAITGLVAPPGKSTLVLRSSTPPTAGHAGDTRPLQFAVYGIEVVEQGSAP